MTQGAHFLAQSFNLPIQFYADAQSREVHAVVVAQAFDSPQFPNRFLVKPPALALRRCDGRDEAVAAIDGNLVTGRLRDVHNGLDGVASSTIGSNGGGAADEL